MKEIKIWVGVEIKYIQLIVYYVESVSSWLHVSTEVAASVFLLNHVHFILSTSGVSHCVIMDIKLSEVFCWSVDTVQCWQKFWMFLSDKWSFSWRENYWFPPYVHTNTCWPGIYVAGSHA